MADSPGHVPPAFSSPAVIVHEWMYGPSLELMGNPNDGLTVTLDANAPAFAVGVRGIGRRWRGVGEGRHCTTFRRRQCDGSRVGRIATKGVRVAAGDRSEGADHIAR